MSSRLQAIREERGLSRAIVAGELGLSEQQLYRLESGKTPAKRLHLLALSEVYGVPVVELEGMADDLLELARTRKRQQAA